MLSAQLCTLQVCPCVNKNSTSFYLSYYRLVGIFLKVFFNLMYMGIKPAYTLVCPLLVWCLWASKRGSSYPLTLQLQMVMSCCVGARNPTQVLYQSSNALSC